MAKNWTNIEITQVDNDENLVTNVGNEITVSCSVFLPGIEPESVEVQLYYGKISDKGVIEDKQVITMDCIVVNAQEEKYEYQTTLELNRSGNYGYTFRVMPKTDMILRPENLNLVKWITK